MGKSRNNPAAIRDLPSSRQHIAYVAPNRHHTRNPIPESRMMGTFKNTNHQRVPVPVPEPPRVPNHYHNQETPQKYPPKRTVQFSPEFATIHNPPSPPPYPSGSLKRDVTSRAHARDCGCRGPCSHRAQGYTTLPRQKVALAQHKDCEMKTVNGWSSRPVNQIDRSAYLDSVV